MDFVLYGVLAAVAAVPTVLFASACMTGARLLNTTEAMSGDCARSLATASPKLDRPRITTAQQVHSFGSRLRVVANDHRFGSASTDAGLR